MKRIANSLKEFSGGNNMRAHPIWELAAARKHASAKQASLYNKLLGSRGVTPAFSTQVCAIFLSPHQVASSFGVTESHSQFPLLASSSPRDLPLAARRCLARESI